MSAAQTTPTITDAIAAMRERLRADRGATIAKLTARGIEPVERTCTPPTDAELRCDYWYYTGALDALEDLDEELTAD